MQKKRTRNTGSISKGGSVLNPKGKFHVEVYGTDGKLKKTIDVQNLVTNEGKNKILDIGFFTATKISTWYIGLIDTTGFTAIAAADTMASHSGWTEFEDYDETDRQTWTTTSPSSQSITNTTEAEFTMSDDSDVRGVFISSDDTKGGATGTMWSVVTFSSSQEILTGEHLKITYTLSL